MYEFLNSAGAKEFDAFVEAHKNGYFTQALEWADVKAGWQSEAIVSRGERGKIRGACLALIRKAPLCSLIYVPRGPVCDYSDSETVLDIAAGIDRLAEKNHAFACICDPPLIEHSESAEVLESAGFSRCDIPEERLIQCRFNYILNLNGKTLDEIRAGFKSNYRNQISKADKLGVQCEQFSGESAINALEDFFPLMEQTGRRDGFPTRPREYFERLLRSVSERARLFMCRADINGKKTPLSGAITVNFGGRFSQVYGASGDLYRNYCPNHKMQWTMICAAHESGCRVYDFGGVPFYYDKSRPEYGLYHFKKGFGGEVTTYAGQFVKIYRRVINRIFVTFSEFLR